MSIHKNELPTKRALEAFFFEGMCTSGWASPNPGITPHPDLTGWKRIVYQTPFGNDTLSLIDTWGDTQGSTTITLHLRSEHMFVRDPQIPLWIMRYEHPLAFSTQALPDLRKILDQTYNCRRFCGGRGETTHGRDVHYWNNWEGGFSQFSGKEDMWVRKDGTSQHIQAGSTTYWGGCLY